MLHYIFCLQVKVQVQRLSYDSVDKYIVLPQKSPLNGALVRSITGQQVNELVDPLKDVPHIVLYLTLVTDESDDAKVSRAPVRLKRIFLCRSVVSIQ